MVCLTGASGFLGSRLLPRLARKGRVVCLGRTKSAESRNVDFIPGDLLDSKVCRKAMEGCDTVVHLAAATGKCSPAEYFRVNRDGTAALVEAARQAGIQRFLYVSTIAAKFHDVSRYYYAQSKQQAEHIVAGSGLRWTIVRPTIILGRGSAALEGLRRLASLPVAPVFGDGRASVQPVFVEDLAEILENMLEDPAYERRVVEIGGPEVLSMEELLLRIRRRLGRGNGPVIHLPAAPIAASLGLVEPALRRFLPVTAGQLASFTNDGTAPPGAWTSAMHTVDEMLQSLAEKNGSA